MSDLLSYILAVPDFRPARLPSLYSDFSQLRQINPDGYAANVQSWNKALSSALRAGKIPWTGASSEPRHDLLILSSGPELIDALTHERCGKPLALGSVINEMLAQRLLIPRAYFLESPTPLNTKSWAELPWRALRWGLSSVGLLGNPAERGGTHYMAGSFVALSNVEEASKGIMAAIDRRTSLTDRIVPRKEFETEFCRVLGDELRLSEADFAVLLKYMLRDARLLAYDDKTVKFKPPNMTQPPPITSHDTTISSLKSLIRDLSDQIAGLNSQISTLTTRLQSLTAQKSSATRTSALATIRLRKSAERALEQREAVLQQVQEVYYKIEQAGNQAEMFAVMEGSIGVLRDLNRQVGDADTVEDFVDELREEMGRTEEVQQVLTEGSVGPPLDDGKLDEELQRMQDEETEARKNAEDKEVRRANKIADEEREKEVEELLTGLQQVSLKDAKERTSEVVEDQLSTVRTSEAPKEEEARRHETEPERGDQFAEPAR